ncbi:glyoxalase/bleomycin resistance protein/dioxygenase [Sorangium cellulosum]|uniref:Glyoxalase/bleomycin resistance protein/dioxygenase n=1 Tax=Sorangium cellulosum TaxID=56 RepID=A0A2L0F0W9_SORCE|nr:VOC family protein [Sorangium cellulosum]AUX45183.1 glyoxalase/bleomycin resistance protein/dioxygenase [Sorangium cellulosum]
MSVRRLFPMLSTESLGRALDFYEGLLGGVQTFRFPEQGPPSFVALRLGESELGLGAIGSGPALHGQPLRPAQGHRIELCVYVDDVDATVERLRAAAVPVVLEPVDQPWGERVAYVSDPDGNLVMLTR